MEKIAENDKCIFYKNEMTRDYGDGYKTVIAEQKKTGYKEYLLIFNDKPIYAHQNLEHIYYRREMLKAIENKKHEKRK